MKYKIIHIFGSPTNLNNSMNIRRLRGRANYLDSLICICFLKNKYSFLNRIGYAEADVVVAVSRIVVVPICNSAVVRIVVPAASAFNSVGAALR